MIVYFIFQINIICNGYINFTSGSLLWQKLNKLQF